MPQTRLNVDDLRQISVRAGEDALVADQLLALYEFAHSRPNGTFLELGTDRGQATNIILEACDQRDGSLASVDILDCSDAASSDRWTFIQCSSLDKSRILREAHFLQDGIDMVYVDSKHTPEHVRQEINLWAPLVKAGGRLYFDDIDSGPYESGARKDNAFMETKNRAILDVIKAYFRLNLHCTRLHVQYGSTGLAWLEILREERLHPLQPNDLPRPRYHALAYRVLRKLGVYQPYQHKRDGSDYLL